MSTADLESELQALNEQIADSDETLQKFNERREKIGNLNKESEGLQTRVTEAQAYLTSAGEAIEGFPSDREMEKLTMTMANLTVDLAAAEGSVAESTTALTAYAQRRQRNIAAILELVQRLMGTVSEVVVDVEASVETEEDLKSTATIADGCDAILASDLTQEEELQATLSKIEEADATLREQAATIDELEEATEECIPEIEAERDATQQTITDEWGKERDLLQAIYNRLLIVTREQHHHLTRGTHIKQAAPKFTKVHVSTLISQNSRLSNDAIATSSRLKDITDDVAVIKRRCATLRTRGRQQLAEYEARKKDQDEAQEAAIASLETVQEEGETLRDVKAELSLTIHEFRDQRVCSPGQKGSR